MWKPSLSYYSVDITLIEKKKLTILSQLAGPGHDLDGHAGLDLARP